MLVMLGGRGPPVTPPKLVLLAKIATLANIMPREGTAVTDDIVQRPPVPGARSRDLFSPTAPAAPPAPSNDEGAPRLRRREATMEAAHAAGLLDGPRDVRVTARLQNALVEAAKRATGLERDSELLAYALARLVAEDDFGERLVARKGRVPRAVDLEF